MLKEGPQVNIHPDRLKATLKKLRNWKIHGLHGIHGFWFKKFTSIHDRLATEMNKCIQKTEIPKWMTKGKTNLIKKCPPPKNASTNYRFITCLLMIWKILTAQIREQIYYSLISRGIFLNEQKGYRKRNRGMEELLYIDRHILNESKTRRKNLAMAWIDNKKAYDMVPQILILHRLKMNEIPDQIVQFIEKTMQTWRMELTTGGQSLTEVKIQRGIFQGTITITICDSQDNTQPHPQEMDSWIQTQ